MILVYLQETNHKILPLSENRVIKVRLNILTVTHPCSLARPFAFRAHNNIWSKRKTQTKSDCISPSDSDVP